MSFATPAADPGSSDTRRRLVDTSLRLFAEHGFKGVSVRDIAAAAGANVAAVSYHFGGKEALYRTIFETVLDEDETVFGEQMAALDRLLARADSNPGGLAAAVEVMVAGVVGRIATYEHAHWFSVLLARELAIPGDLFDLIYRRRAEPVLSRMVRVVAAARGTDPTDPETRLIAHLLYGQAGSLVFTRPVLWRQLGWERNSPERVEQVTRALTELICRSLGLDSAQSSESGSFGGRV